MSLTKVTVQHDPTHTVIAAEEKILVKVAESVCHRGSTLSALDLPVQTNSFGFQLDSDLCGPEGHFFRGAVPRKNVHRYCSRNENFVLGWAGFLGRLKSDSTEEALEIVYDPLIEAIELRPPLALESGIAPGIRRKPMARRCGPEGVSFA